MTEHRSGCAIAIAQLERDGATVSATFDLA